MALPKNQAIRDNEFRKRYNRLSFVGHIVYFLLVVLAGGVIGTFSGLFISSLLFQFDVLPDTSNVLLFALYFCFGTVVMFVQRYALHDTQNTLHISLGQVAAIILAFILIPTVSQTEVLAPDVSNLFYLLSLASGIFWFFACEFPPLISIQKGILSTLNRMPF